MSVFTEEYFENPIDADKVTTIPGLLPYPHHVGSPAFAPTEVGAIRSGALRAMQEQNDMHLKQIKEQIDLLARQAEKLMERIEISKAVYAAEMNFQPVIGNVYHLYARAEGIFVLSMVAPDEWGARVPFTYFAASVQLMADHTWQVIHSRN